MLKPKAQIKEDELDTFFLESKEHARLSREAFKKTYGLLKGWKRSTQEMMDFLRKEL